MPPIKNLPEAQAQTRAAADKAKDLGLITNEYYQALTDGTVNAVDRFYGEFLCNTLENNLVENPQYGPQMAEIRTQWDADAARYLKVINDPTATEQQRLAAEKEYNESGGPLFTRYANSGKLDEKTIAALFAADALDDAVDDQIRFNVTGDQLRDIINNLGAVFSQWSKIWELT